MTRTPLAWIKTVEQSVTAGLLDIVLAATDSSVRRIPGQHVPVLAQPAPVVVADDGRALAVTRPTRTGGVAAGSRIQTARIRASQHVVAIRLVGAGVNEVADASPGANQGGPSQPRMVFIAGHRARSLILKRRSKIKDLTL